jgi:hypothetical protein
MADTAAAAKSAGKRGSAGWYVLLLAWPLYGGAFFALERGVKPAADVTNGELLAIFGKWSPLFGFALGLASLLASSIVYLIVRLIMRRPSRAAAAFLTALAYAPWLVFGSDLVYREKRYAELARAIITYLGKPMLVSAEIVCGAAILTAVLSLIFKKRAV